MPTSDSIIGESITRIDDAAKVTGEARFTVDIQLPDMLYGKILRSPHPHARVVSIDANQALALEGVIVVLTKDNVPDVAHSGHSGVRSQGMPKDQKILDEVVRFVGDGVAAVAAISEEIATQALDLIEVEYEILEPVFDPHLAMKPDAPSLHNTAQNLVGDTMILSFGELEEGFSQADFIIEGEYDTGRATHGYLEPNVCIAAFDSVEKLTIWSSTQCPFFVRSSLSEVLEIDLDKVQVICNFVGGAFGGKQDLYQHEFLCALLARKAGLPVKIEYSREEVFVSARTRHPSSIYLKQGVKADGTITARFAKLVTNTGAYASHGPGITWVGLEFLSSMYACENVHLEGYCVYTNTPIAGAMRGYGSPQAAFALESQMDEIAERLRIDPLELRMQNAIRLGDRSPTGRPLEDDGLHACLMAASQISEWIDRSPSSESDDGRFQHGWGVAAEIHGSGAFPFYEERSDAVVRIEEDGRAGVYVGIMDLGTGARTVMAQIAAQELGYKFEDIQLFSGDTDIVPFDLGAYGSRTSFIGGTAVKKASAEVRKKLLEFAATMLEVEAEQLDIRDGVVYFTAEPARSIELRQLLCSETRPDVGPLFSHVTHIPTVAYSYGVNVAAVIVDTLTGMVRVEKIYALHEVGTVLNLRSIEGQIEGGLLQGVGYALTEDLVINPKTGHAINPDFTDYKMPGALDAPELIPILLEAAPHEEGPFGAKGVAEDPLIPTGAAIANAVYDAVGVRFPFIPLIPEKILEGLQQGRSGEI
jgi:CO/xanthine dehydrogenase Mo-binding subunit